MINRTKLLADLKVQVRDLESDLRGRFATHAEYKSRLTTEWQAARDAGRTSEAVETWPEAQFTQSAVAWVLACVFVRFCEDNDLLDAPLIAGTDARRQSAVARQEAFYLQNPTASDNDYLRDVFAVASRLPGLSDVMKVQRVLLTAPVSADMGKQLVRFFRATNADTGALVHDFADPDWNTRFLGDLYQDLSEAARERYALLQTPEFVESFILDRTLTPALDIYTLEEVDLIDPTCGSGHFLLGAFERLAPRWLRKRPDNINLALQEALDRIAGIDLNPYAVVIARFRLLVAALKMARVHKLRLAPDFHLHIETGDSLLHGFDQRDYARAQVSLALNTPQENLATAADHLYRHAFAAEDLTATNQILARKYAAVVGNPPYITVKDQAVSVLYRQRFQSCHRTYALVAPFCERFWALARNLDNTQRAGFVGLIVSDSFKKREFGKKLVEGFFPTVELSYVIDTSGAYIPGHGTPTVILLGQNRPPVNPSVRAVLGINGEPSTPSDPGQGIVWNAILTQIDRRDSASEWVSVHDFPRDKFYSHPWALAGGGAADLLERINAAGAEIISAFADVYGGTGRTSADDAFVLARNTTNRLGVESSMVRPLVEGDNVREWAISSDEHGIVPYAEQGLVSLSDFPGLHRYLWTFRTLLGNRATFGQGTYFSDGKAWWSWHQITLARLTYQHAIAFGEVATHNHFVLDRGGKVFKQTAPVIKLPANTTEDDNLGILGLLNSSTSCFWLKQVCFPKGGDHMGTEGARVRRSLWDERFAHDSTKVGQFPVAVERPVEIAKRIDSLATQRATRLPDATFGLAVPTRATLDAAKTEVDRIRSEMIAWQEELDWQAYRIYGVLDEPLCYSDAPPGLQFGERAFEILLARQMAAGTTSTTWFERHGAQPIAECPARWPADYRALVERRISTIQQSRDLALIERPECKRRWAGSDWDKLEKVALEGWLLDRLEATDLWPRDAQPAPRLRSVRELVDALTGDESFRRAMDLYAGTGSDAHATVTSLLLQATVPYLDVLRYTDSGLRKRSVWRSTWALQRKEDAIDFEVSRTMVAALAEDIAAEQQRRKTSEIGAIPVPPKYKPEDFLDGPLWKQRGPLDVPKERFISFPGLERSNDAGSPMLLWAGYDAKARALALTGQLYEMLQREGADAARLTPALAGLDELLPWVHQWHPEIDDDLGMSTGDYLQGLLDAQLAQHGLTLTAVRAWQPPAPVRRTRGRRSSAAAQA